MDLKQKELADKFDLIHKRQQNILLCLYELKKEIIYLQYETRNYYPDQLKKICVKGAYEYVSDKFPEFQMPQEVVELYV